MSTLRADAITNSAGSGSPSFPNGFSTPSVTNAGTLALTATGANVITATTNGLERVRIDANGYMTVPYQPAFDAVLAGVTAGVYYSANQAVVFDRTNLNRGGHYNTSNGRFTAPVSGVYCFSVTGMTQVTTWYELRINGADITWRHGSYGTSTNSIWASVSSTWVVQMNAGDYAQIFIGASGSGIYGGGNNHNNFSGYMIG